jgi:hypothetical protein
MEGRGDEQEREYEELREIDAAWRDCGFRCTPSSADGDQGC